MKKVLVVDDNPDTRQIMVDVLHMNGFAAESARDGAEGLQKARAERPDAIILDLVMPAMDGFEVLQRLKEGFETSSVPVVIVTAKDDEASYAKGQELGAKDFLTKPIEPEQVIRKIRRLLGLSLPPL